MATGTNPSTVSVAGGERLTLADIAQAIVMPLASLRLTVALLSLAIFVTFVATLEQNWADVYNVKMRHFSNLVVSIPLQTFFVPAWFPEMQNVPGRIFIPSGFSVLALLLINLTAAHIMRFRLQATGVRLLLGGILAAFAGLVTWAIVFNNQNASGFQNQPPISYQTMWLLMQLVLLVLSITSAALCFRTHSGQKIERVLLVFASLVTGGLLAVTVIRGDAAFIGEAAMRVMWQMIQATMAACVAYAACLVLFKRKAGMVLLHLGVAGLMMNEIFVTVTNNEQRMTVFENETVSHAIDIRHTELAVIDVSDPEFDSIVTVPGSRLKPEAKISEQDLPFDIECVAYFPASDVREVTTVTENPADSGVGTQMEAFPIPPVAGTDSEQVADFASTYVKLKDKKSGKSLGTYLVSQMLKTSSNRILVDGKEYFLGLQFETEYKPYSVHLKDATRENYPGTMTPKYYGSQVALKDLATGAESSRQIYMNNPLRYSDETFYQSGMDVDDAGRQYSVFQVVTNVGWMIPYVCCMFTVVGLVAQFGESLLGFLKAHQAKRANAHSASNKDVVPTAELADGTDVVADRRRVNVQAWILAAVVTSAFAAWAGGMYLKAYRPLVHNGMRLDLLAKVPITFEGRVQPLGSYAINTARQLRHRETLTDGDDKSQPAIRWIADVMFDAERADEYRAFYITDPNIINNLDLPKSFTTRPKRKQYVYTFGELFPAGPELEKLAPNPELKKQKTWTPEEFRLFDLKLKMQKVMGMRFTFGMEDSEDKGSVLNQIERLEFATSTLGYTPFLVPVDEETQSWISFSQYQGREFIQTYLDKYDCETIDQLAEKLHDQEVVSEVRKNMVIDAAIVRLITDFPESRKVFEEKFNESDPRRLAAMIKQQWSDFPENVRSKLEAAEGPMIDAMLQQQRGQTVGILKRDLVRLNGRRDGVGLESVGVGTVELLSQLAPAYREGDAETFNSILTKHLAAYESAEAHGYFPYRMDIEYLFNHAMPFYVSMAVYLAAVLFAFLSWIGYQSDVFRTAMARIAVSLLVFGLLFHFGGMAMRVTISGRPPVTNLYSSALFVGMVSVALLLICERFTKMGICSALAGLSGFASLVWAYTMTITDGDTFTVMQAVLDTNFWLATHVVCISIGYSATFVGGLMGVGFVIAGMFTNAFASKGIRRMFINMLYGAVCMALLTSFFGTVLGGLWGDDSWGRFWGWDPKENGALMIVLANAVVLHARWGGMVKERGLAILAILGNIVVLWSWKGVNAMGVGLHAYGGTEDKALFWIVCCGALHLVICAAALLPQNFWMSYTTSEHSLPDDGK